MKCIHQNDVYGECSKVTGRSASLQHSVGLGTPLRNANVQKTGAGKAFFDGMIVNLLNPKVILFVLAFVPQFVNPESGNILGQFLIFGLVLAVGGMLVNGGVGVFAGTLGQRMTGPGFARGLGWISAGIFVALAARLAVLVGRDRWFGC